MISWGRFPHRTREWEQLYTLFVLDDPSVSSLSAPADNILSDHDGSGLSDPSLGALPSPPGPGHHPPLRPLHTLAPVPPLDTPHCHWLAAPRSWGCSSAGVTVRHEIQGSGLEMSILRFGDARVDGFILTNRSCGLWPLKYSLSKR